MDEQGSPTVLLRSAHRVSDLMIDVFDHGTHLRYTVPPLAQAFSLPFGEGGRERERERERREGETEREKERERERRRDGETLLETMSMAPGTNFEPECVLRKRPPKIMMCSSEVAATPNFSEFHLLLRWLQA